MTMTVFRIVVLTQTFQHLANMMTNGDKKGERIMPYYNVMLDYEEYCIDCVNEGITPLPFWKWLYENIR